MSVTKSISVIGHPKVGSRKRREDFIKELSTAKPSQVLLTSEAFERLWNAYLFKQFGIGEGKPSGEKPHPRT